MRPTQPPLQWVLGVLFPSKVAGVWLQPLTPSSTMVKNEQSYMSAVLLHHSWHVWGGVQPTVFVMQVNAKILLFLFLYLFKNHYKNPFIIYFYTSVHNITISLVL